MSTGASSRRAYVLVASLVLVCASASGCADDSAPCVYDTDCALFTRCEATRCVPLASNDAGGDADASDAPDARLEQDASADVGAQRDADLDASTPSGDAGPDPGDGASGDDGLRREGGLRWDGAMRMM